MGAAIPPEPPGKARKGNKNPAGNEDSSSSGGTEEPSARRKNAVLHATAGAIAGAISRFVVGPLDVLKIRFQVQLEPIASSRGAAAMPSHYTSIHQALVTIVKEEGVRGLWRGTVPGQLLTIPYTAVQFVALQQCRMLAERHGLSTHPFWQHAMSFVSGACAGAAGTVASYPFDLLRTTLAAQGEPKVYTSMTHAARSIVSEQGIRGLYRGLGITVLEIIPYAALQFGLYDAFMQAYTHAWMRMDPRCCHEPPPPTGFQCFVCGLAAGTLAKLGTHPLDVVKKRYQVAGLQRSMRYGRRVPLAATASLWHCMHEIWVQEGLKGLYKGAAPSILKAAPSAAVTFAMYDLVIKLITSKAGASARKPTSAHQHKAAAAAGGSAGGKQQQQQQAPATT